jgi:transcription initiation factor TFIID subunit TAF12
MCIVLHVLCCICNASCSIGHVGTNAADFRVCLAVPALTRTVPLVAQHQALEQTQKLLAALLLHIGLQLRLASSGQQQQQQQGKEASFQGTGL